MSENGVKPWWQSRTIWAALGVFLLTVATELGLGISSDDAAQIGEGVGGIATGVLALVAIWGRIKASRRIGPDE